MYAAQARGKKFHVFCDETRPRSQGATSRVGTRAAKNFPSNHCRQRAGHLMQRGEIDLVIVGSDRRWAAPASRNKIAPTPRPVGQAACIPFYVAIPLRPLTEFEAGSTSIEERCESEVLGAWELRKG